jgi:zinc transport system substrate-binding protein
MNKGVLIALLALLCWTPLTHAASASEGVQADIQVIASIRPLALIANDLLGPLGDVTVLVAGAASPHDYSLRVSDVQRLREADLVIWMGPDLERFLEKPLAALPEDKVLTLAADPARHQPGADHRHGDPHQWLDPRLAKEMARQIADRLESLNPRYGDEIQARLDRLTATYQELFEEARQALEPVREVGFVVEHRGYDHFVETFELRQLGWLSATPEQLPGVRHLYELEKRLRSGAGARCLFMELAHQSSAARNLAAQLELRPQALDILGHNAITYEEFIQHLVRDVVSCLAGR